VNVDDPIAKVCSSHRLAFHNLDVENLVSQEGCNLGTIVVSHVLPAVRLQTTLELINVGHHLLGAVPLVVLVLLLEQDQTARSHKINTSGRIREILELCKHGFG
jgi:hypothetical protein